MRQVHLIMPFMRRVLKQTLIEAYRLMGIIWHPVMFQNEMTDFNEPWIFPLIIPMNSEEFKGILPWSFKRNYFIQNHEIIDDDYYVCPDDDDIYEAGVFDAIKQMDDNIVIISMKRGDFIPIGVPEVRKYPTTTLYAHPDNVQIGLISTQQLFYKGKIFKNHLYDNLDRGEDGWLAIHHKESGEQIRYEPNLFALFNYYEPGRWDKGNHKIAFGCMVNNIQRLDMVLRKSEIEDIPCYTIMDPASATKGLNKLLDIIEGKGAEIGVLTHQDSYYRKGWVEQMQSQISLLPGSWIVAGVVGKNQMGKICGIVHDMRQPLFVGSHEILPVECCCMDECCIIINIKSGFRFDETLEGFDLYGTLAVLQAQKMGGSAWIIDAPIEHYCLRSYGWEPNEQFKESWKWLYNRFPGQRLDSTVIREKMEEEAAEVKIN